MSVERTLEIETKDNAFQIKVDFWHEADQEITWSNVRLVNDEGQEQKVFDNFYSVFDADIEAYVFKNESKLWDAIQEFSEGV